MSASRLLAIDPSLTCSGMALFDVPSGKLVGAAKIKSLPPTYDLAARLQDLQNKVVEAFDSFAITSSDVVVCEAPTTMRDPRAAFKVEQVRCIFETLARTRGSTVPGRINPRSVHFEVLGLRGKQVSRPIVKSAALQVAALLFGPSLEKMGITVHQTNQDIIDAVLLGSLGVAWVQSCRMAGLPLATHFEESVGKRFTRGRRY